MIQRRLSLATLCQLAFFATALAWTTGITNGCGGGSGRTNPTPPEAVVTAEAQIVDVGERYFLDATQSREKSSDAAPFEGEALSFTWRVTSPSLAAVFDDYCEDAPLTDTDDGERCTMNDDDTCVGDDTIFCNSDEDCVGADTLGECDFNSGTTSADCTTGICELMAGNDGQFVSFLADTAGPFTVRLVATSSNANDIDNFVVDTFPSAFVVGSLVEFGGTKGGFVRQVTAANRFAPDATRGLADPNSGDLILIDPVLGVLRVFDLVTGSVSGGFGSSDTVVDEPVAAAFHADGDLYIAEADGSVLELDGDTGLFVRNVGNFGAGIVAMEFAPNGTFLVVTGVAGSGVRVFSNSGQNLGILGDTATDVDRPVDLDFLDDSTLLIADAAGDVIVCDDDGNGCGPFGDVGTLLDDGSPRAIAVNPSADDTDNVVLIADPVNQRVLACDESGIGCGVFGDAEADGAGRIAELNDSDFSDVFFAPPVTPTTSTTSTTSTSSTTTTTLSR